MCSSDLPSFAFASRLTTPRLKSPTPHMDAMGFRAPSEVLQVSEPDLVTRMRADYEHRAMAAEDCRASQQQVIYESRTEAWAQMASRMTMIMEDIRAEWPNEDPQVVLDFALVHYHLPRFFEEVVAFEGSMDYFQAAFVRYHASDCRFAQVGPVHGRWTDEGPVPKRRCTEKHECTWH